MPCETFASVCVRCGLVLRVELTYEMHVLIWLVVKNVGSHSPIRTVASMGAWDRVCLSLIRKHQCPAQFLSQNKPSESFKN